MSQALEAVLRKHRDRFSPVVPFEPATQRLISLDLSATNPELSSVLFSDLDSFQHYIEEKLNQAGAVYGIGGYGELRDLYTRSELFGEHLSPQGLEPRRYHIGQDIWGKAGTPVFSFGDGELHSQAFNRQFGDYGATLIVKHRIEECNFYLLYGHLRLADLASLKPGQRIHAGDCIAHFGQREENGGWPPHLHLQIISDLEGANGDYPGVCRFSERFHYLANCPDPDLILQMNRYL